MKSCLPCSWFGRCVIKYHELLQFILVTFPWTQISTSFPPVNFFMSELRYTTRISISQGVTIWRRKLPEHMTWLHWSTGVHQHTSTSRYVWSVQIFFILAILWWEFMQSENYQQELDEMKRMTRQEYVAHLRRWISLSTNPKWDWWRSHLSLLRFAYRRSSGFSRGASMYRGVTRWRWRGVIRDGASTFLSFDIICWFLAI